MSVYLVTRVAPLTGATKDVVTCLLGYKKKVVAT